MKNITTIAFDADDTLWVNEPYFREVEEKFCNLLSDYGPKEEIENTLYRIEMQNIELYGYGIKGFILSMIETTYELSKGGAPLSLINEIIEQGKAMYSKPLRLLEGVQDVLMALNGDYRMVMATKGDLLDQERKLYRSGLEQYFHHIEVMSDKRVRDYKKLIQHLDCKPENFLMVGNSLKSDILPVLELGAYAVYVPFHTTWIHEQVDHELDHENAVQVEHISEFLSFLRN